MLTALTWHATTRHRTHKPTVTSCDADIWMFTEPNHRVVSPWISQKRYPPYEVFPSSAGVRTSPSILQALGCFHLHASSCDATAEQYPLIVWIVLPSCLWAVKPAKPSNWLSPISGRFSTVESVANEHQFPNVTARYSHGLVSLYPFLEWHRLSGN